MLAGGTAPVYRRALAGPHRHYVRIEVWDGTFTNRLISDLTILSGDVSATLSSQVTRRLSMSVTDALYPVNPTDPLAPYGNQLRVYRGVELNGDTTTYVWQVFEGRIQDVDDNGDGTVTVQASDVAQDVLDYGFERPTNSSTGSQVTAEFRRLINEAVPGATYGTFDVGGMMMPQETWEQDRGGALDEMAAAMGAFWWALADGSFVLRRIPWTVAGSPVVTLTDLDGGTVLNATPRRSRSTVWNSWTVTGERADSTQPVYATRRDMTPGSITNIAGPFGRRANHANLNTPSNFGTADYVAQVRLQASLALTEDWTYQCTPDASVELGDIQRLQVRGRDVVQVVESFSLPLDLSGEMVVGTRSQVITQIEAA